MDRTERIELAVLCLLTRGDELLLQNRVKQDWQGYALPGSHVEKDESIVEAVVREMREETGLTVRNPRLCGVKQFPIENGRYLVLLFQATDYEGELRSSDEGEMRWVPRTALESLPTVEDFAELLRLMESPELSEFYYLPNGEDWDVILR